MAGFGRKTQGPKGSYANVDFTVILLDPTAYHPCMIYLPTFG